MFITAVLLASYSLLVLNFITPELVMSQVSAIVVGIISYGLHKSIDTSVFQRLWFVWYIICIIILVLTLLTPEIRGAHRWLIIGTIRIQPSELIKPFFIMILAGYLSSIQKKGIVQFITISLISAIPILLIFKQPDLGNSIVYIIIFISLLFLSNFSIWYLILPTIVGSLGLPLVWHFLENYQKLRILTFINPGFDIQGVGYNAHQALIAVGSGGLLGKGLGQGTQSKLQFLPEFHTDFIFASTVEQLGFAGGVILIILYALLLIKIIRVIPEQNEYNQLVAIGFITCLFCQIFINMGMNIGIVPITGITLPLFSYGGSSIVSTFIGLGIVSRFGRKKVHTIAIH